MRESDPRQLRRYRLGGVLGEGADVQVFAASDEETGDPVVVKRPHPSLVKRGIHDDVQCRMALQADVRRRTCGPPGVAQLHFLTEPDGFEWYFGDDLGRDYTVGVEERARGIPLLASVVDQVRGHPIALPLNLFVLHRLRVTGVDSPVFKVLDVVESCLEFGLMAHDLAPQNVFYRPRSGETTVIDLGALLTPRPETQRLEALDLNDVLLEFFRWYTTPKPTPTVVEEYCLVNDARLLGRLDRRSRTLSEEYSQIADEAHRSAAQGILERIADRGYTSIPEFRADLRGCIDAAEAIRPLRDSLRLWDEALEELRASYWSKYLFSAESDLPDLS